MRNSAGTDAPDQAPLPRRSGSEIAVSQMLVRYDDVGSPPSGIAERFFGGGGRPTRIATPEQIPHRLADLHIVLDQQDFGPEQAVGAGRYGSSGAAEGWI